MEAFDPRTGVPVWWSLRPEDTLGLVFWTRQPRNLIERQDLLDGHSVHIHLTVTGWEEVEHKAPTLEEGIDLLRKVARAYGPENVTWRFSPIPVVPDAVDRFERILDAAVDVGVSDVFLSFLQTNDRMAETRSDVEKLALLQDFSDVSAGSGMKIYLCNEDRLLSKHPGIHNVQSGVCAPPEMYALSSRQMPPSEGCGCVLMADPFTITESCSFGCEYCYAADMTLSSKKRSTTRVLPVIR